MFDVSGIAAVALSNWYTNAYEPVCLQGFDTYLRQVKFSPDGSYFVVVEHRPGILTRQALRLRGALRDSPASAYTTRPGCSAPAVTRSTRSR